jgi:hypothetical protein
VATWVSILAERSVNCYGMENEVLVGGWREEVEAERVDSEEDGS